jgi:hypothetical protein
MVVVEHEERATVAEKFKSSAYAEVAFPANDALTRDSGCAGHTSEECRVPRRRKWSSRHCVLLLAFSVLDVFSSRCSNHTSAHRSLIPCTCGSGRAIGRSKINPTATDGCMHFLWTHCITHACFCPISCSFPVSPAHLCSFDCRNQVERHEVPAGQSSCEGTKVDANHNDATV